MRYRLIYIIITINFLCILQLDAQDKHGINCSIFINGKMIRGLSGVMSIENKEETISINYEATLGEIYISQEDYKKLTSYKDYDKKLNMSILHTSYKYATYQYDIELRLRELLSDFILIRVTHLNKKGTKYHYGISSPIGDTPFIRKEYMMLEEY